MKPLAIQRGSTLLVSLIMLMLLTLMAISAIESSTSSIQVVGNAQFRAEATAAAQQAIENVISSTAFTSTAPSAQTINVNKSDYTVSFLPAPTCSQYKAVDTTTETGLPSVCYSSVGAQCYRTFWDINAVVDDATTGTKISVHQGVKILVGLNAALASCGV